MVSMMQSGGADDQFLGQAMQEVVGQFEEPVTVKRFTGATAGDDAAMQANVGNYALFLTTANITSLDAKEANTPNTIYAIGDLRAEFRIPIYGEEAQQGDKGAQARSDQVIYRGRTYKIVGHVMTPELNGVPYYQAVLRQI